MNRLVIIVGILIVLAGGGMLTTQLVSQGSDLGSLMPYLQQTTDPAASPLQAEPWQAEQFILLVGFILFNMVGIGATIALIMWFLDRGVRISRAEAEQQESN